MKKTQRTTIFISLIMMSCLFLPQLAQAATTNQISQYGITWTFDKEYEYGQFVNGDYWVVGPVTITSISPGSAEIEQDGEIFTVDGSMVNPTPAGIEIGKQGYDSRGWGSAYDPNLNVGTSFVLAVNQSLVSAISWRIGETGCPARVSSDPNSPLYHMPRPCLKTAAVLTCLASTPESGSFRPPYAGAEKPLFNTSQLVEAILPDLTTVAGAPSVATAKEWVQRVWLDHMTRESMDYLRPSLNLPNYGRDWMDRVNQVSLLMMTNIATADKHDLTVYMTQIGIDQYYVIKAGGGWGKSGGAINIGHKWPILLAGLLLNDPNMKAIGTTYPTSSYRFQEDSQTFYITQADVDRFPATTRTNCAITHETYNGKTAAIITDSDGGSWWNNDEGGQQPFLSGRGFPDDFWVRVHRGGGVYDVVRADAIHNADNSKIRIRYDTSVGPYELLDTGTGLTVEIQLFPVCRMGYPEWGERHAYQPQTDYYSRGYRTVGGKAFHGEALSALILNAKTLWNHDAFFDWTDMQMAEFIGIYRSQSAFTANMWDTYRANYGPVWPDTTFLYGDLSGEGEVTAYDAALTAQAAVELITLTPEQTKAADVSGEGEVTAYDAALIAQKAVKLIDKFPVEE